LDVFAFSASRSTEKSWPHFRPSAPPTGEGRKRAKERGIRFGRPRKMMPHQRQEALQRLAAGETQADVARTYARRRRHDQPARGCQPLSSKAR